ncbi:hypothetical protein NMY22_g17111 [Coprinellus aureogranulatus]|nr:hypothetical protein NMY22_g17111 [Coprinellus aureogranulatus]
MLRAQVCCLVCFLLGLRCGVRGWVGGRVTGVGLRPRELGFFAELVFFGVLLVAERRLTVSASHPHSPSVVVHPLFVVVSISTITNLVLQQQQQTTSVPIVEKESTPTPSKDVEAKEEKSAEKETLTERITEWMKNVEGKWNTVQEEWNQERERLGRAREEWESKARLVDSNLARLTT